MVEEFKSLLLEKNDYSRKVITPQIKTLLSLPKIMDTYLKTKNSLLEESLGEIKGKKTRKKN